MSVASCYQQILENQIFAISSTELRGIITTTYRMANETNASPKTWKKAKAAAIKLLCEQGDDLTIVNHTVKTKTICVQRIPAEIAALTKQLNEKIGCTYCIEGKSSGFDLIFYLTPAAHRSYKNRLEHIAISAADEQKFCSFHKVETTTCINTNRVVRIKVTLSFLYPMKLGTRQVAAQRLPPPEEKIAEHRMTTNKPLQDELIKFAFIYDDHFLGWPSWLENP